MAAEEGTTTSRLVIVCGLPGAGKTTLAKHLEADYGAVRMCPDEWTAELGIDLFDESMRPLVEGLQWRMAERLLRLGVSVRARERMDHTATVAAQVLPLR